MNKFEGSKQEGGERAPVYETKRVQIPDKFEKRGFKGTGYAQVFELSEPVKGYTHEIRFGVSLDQEHARGKGVDEFDFLPTTTASHSLEEARNIADKAVEDIENWDNLEEYN